MKTKKRYTRSFSIVFLAVMLLTIWLTSQLSVSGGDIENHFLATVLQGGDDFKMTKVIQFVADLVSYSL